MPLVTKIFGVGLARTGTTSMHEAMGLLEIRSAPSSVALLDDLDHPLLEEYDAFFDNPIPFRYHQIDEAWPGSRFIATTRSLDGWLQSMQWLFDVGLERLNPADRMVGDRVHRECYGITQFDSEVLAGLWHRHHENLRDYFHDRSNDVLWLDLDQGFEWAPLCEFLGVTEPSAPFPHVNSANSPSRLSRLHRRLRRVAP